MRDTAKQVSKPVERDKAAHEKVQPAIVMS